MSRLTKLGFIDTRRTRLPVRRRVQSRGVPVALADHEVFCTDDPAETSSLLDQFLAPGRLSLPEHPSEPFQATLHAIRLRDVTMAYLDLHGGATLDISRTGEMFTVHMPTSGQATGRYAGNDFTAASHLALVTSPGQPLAMTFDVDSPQLVIRIELSSMERLLSRMLGRSLTRPIRFAPVLDLTTDAAVRWNGAMQMLSTEIVTERSLIQEGLGAGPLEEFITSALLLVQPSTYSDELARSSALTQRRAVHRSISYIEENLARPISLEDLCIHTRMSARSIQQGFRDDLGTTPTAYIRDMRLDRVRAVLTDSLPGDGVTVTEVAERWGFTHLGNFSAVYRKRFGETPSRTLRR